MTKMNMFSSDKSNDFTDGAEAGEPLIVIICNCSRSKKNNYKKTKVAVCTADYVRMVMFIILLCVV